MSWIRSLPASLVALSLFAWPVQGADSANSLAPLATWRLQARVVAVDIEPYGEQCPGAARVDAAFIEGWYDGVMMAGYIPLYYGNGTAGSEFGNAWCRAVKERPEVAVDSFLWTFQPSLQAKYRKSRAPEFNPNTPGCAGNFAVWQYMLSAGARPDVDHDEALSTVPLWFPQAASGPLA